MYRSRADQNRLLRKLAENQGMQPCKACKVIKGKLAEASGIYVSAEDVPASMYRVWVKHRWTIELDGSSYAVGQDRKYMVIAYAPLEVIEIV